MRVWSEVCYTFDRHKYLHLELELELTIKIVVACYRIPEATVQVTPIDHGTLYKTIGMKPKYTGYIPRKYDNRLCKFV